MRGATLVLTVVGWIALCGYALAQKPEVSDAAVFRHCGAFPISEGQDFEQLQSVGKRVAGSSANTIPIVLIDSHAFNAWTSRLDDGTPLVCIPSGLVAWEREAEGELAFIVGHEIGHAVDDRCRTIEGRAALAKKSHSLVALLFGSSNGDEAGDFRKCELRADAIGLERMTAAGYEQQDAVRAFERLRALHRDGRKGVLGRMAAIGSDHPITMDRIHHLMTLIAGR